MEVTEPKPADDRDPEEMDDPTEACDCGTYPRCACGRVHELERENKALAVRVAALETTMRCMARSTEDAVKVYHRLIQDDWEAAQAARKEPTE